MTRRCYPFFFLHWVSTPVTSRADVYSLGGCDGSSGLQCVSGDASVWDPDHVGHGDNCNVNFEVTDEDFAKLSITLSNFL